MNDALRLTRQGSVARVTLSRPELRNALDAGLIGDLHRTFESFASDEPVALRAVVIEGAGRVFCAGADVAWMRASIGLTVEDNERDADALRAMLAAVEACPAPVVARVQGAALGGGMGLCAVADIVIAGADAVFGFTETKLGIVPAVISPFVLAKIGESHARALFSTGQRFDAERARSIGLVHEVAADLATLDARVDAVLAELLSAGPTAAREAKALVLAQRGQTPAEAGAETVRHIARVRTSPEGQEGLSAFVERRKPSWTGS